MSQSVAVSARIREHHIRKYESGTQSVQLQSYNASDLYWDVPCSDLGWGIDYSDRGIRSFPATIQAYNGIDKISEQQLPFECFQIHDCLIMLPFGAI
jgi:hypothetical protein